jgi:hypothetical protein
MDQLLTYEKDLGRSVEEGGAGSYNNDVILPAALNWPFDGTDIDMLGDTGGDYFVPAGSLEERSQFHLPGYGEEITDITSSDLNPWAWNPQRFVQRYNQTVDKQGPMAGPTLIRAMEAMRQAYPEAYQMASQQLNASGLHPAPLPPNANTQGGPPVGAYGLQPLSNKDTVGGPPVGAYGLNSTSHLKAEPVWNDGPGYQPGRGLLPLAQMAEQFSPGVTQQMLQMSGPAGLPLLTDVNALGQFVGMGRNAARTPPPPARPAPAPNPPRTPQPTTPAAPKPKLPGGPRLPQQPRPPRGQAAPQFDAVSGRFRSAGPAPSYGGKPPMSQLPGPKSPVPGG